MTYSDTTTAANLTTSAFGVGRPTYTATGASPGWYSYTTINVQFVGTGIALIGSGSPTDNVSWKCDLLDHNKTDHVGENWLAELAYARNLDWGVHSCVFNIFSTTQMTVREVMILTGMQG